MTQPSDNDKLKKAQARAGIAAGIRMFFMLLTLLLVLFVFFCNKLAGNSGWYHDIRPVVYNILTASAVFMLAAIIARMFLAAKYHQLLSEEQEAQQ